MRCAIPFIGVLFHACGANRLHTQHVLEITDAASLFSTDVVAAFEKVAADEKDQAQQWCTAMSAQSTRTFRFELTYPDGERTAMELERHPRDPKIRFYRGRTWSVRLLRTPAVSWTGEPTGEMQESLEWTPVVPDANGEPRLDEHGNMMVDASAPLVIDVRKDLAYIKRTQPEGETPTGIEFGFMNGNTQFFAGGLYYPENAMQRSLVRAFRQRQREHEREMRAAGLNSTEVSTLNRHAEGRELTVGGARVAVDATSNMVSQIYESGKISAITAFAFSFLPLVGSNPFALGAAWTATVAGVHAGVIYGAAFIVPTSIMSAIHTWRHQRRELSMTASEKIFEKFACHRMIGVCENAELVGRDSIFAFAGRPDGDVLIPFNGDIDPVTLVPLPATVTWGTQVNNSGNIECIDRRV